MAFIKTTDHRPTTDYRLPTTDQPTSVEPTTDQPTRKTDLPTTDQRKN